jgi:hypothetical protein
MRHLAGKERLKWIIEPIDHLDDRYIRGCGRHRRACAGKVHHALARANPLQIPSLQKTLEAGRSHLRQFTHGVAPNRHVMTGDHSVGL